MPNENTRYVKSPPAHPYTAILNLSALSTIGRCPENFVMISLTI